MMKDYAVKSMLTVYTCNALKIIGQQLVKIFNRIYYGGAIAG